MYFQQSVLLVGACLMMGCSDRLSVLYVSPNGNDAVDGTQRAPLATLTGARDRIRQLKASPEGLPKGGVTVLFSPGTYRLAEAVSFDGRDSGADPIDELGSPPRGIALKKDGHA